MILFLCILELALEGEALFWMFSATADLYSPATFYVFYSASIVFCYAITIVGFRMLYKKVRKTF